MTKFNAITDELKAEREADYQAEIASIDPKDTLALYWADSAGASVIRDYKAGRVEEIKAQHRARRKNKNALSRAVRVAR